MKSKLRTLISITLVLCLTFLTSGCWDSREVENLAIFTMLGIDWVTENGVDQWQVSARVMRIGGQNQGNEKSGTKGGSQEILWKGTGSTLQEAFANIVVRSPRNPFYGHVSLYIIGERVAKEKLVEWQENNKRWFDVRPRVYLMVTKGEAFQVLQAGPEISPALSKEILEMNKQTIRQNGYSKDVTSARFTAWLMSPDREAVLPEIKVIYPKEQKGAEVSGPDKSVAIEGLGVFRGTKLVGWLNREENLGSQLLMDNLSGTIFLPVEIDGAMFTYVINRSNPKLKAGLAGEKLSIQVSIETQGSVADPNEVNISTEEMSRLEAATGDKIRDLALTAIDKAKEYDSDFLGFTEKLHRINPSAWQQIEPHWRDSFQEADVDVEVKAKILDTGKSGQKLKLKQ